MKKYFIGVSLVLFGFVIAFPLFSMTYYTMVRTSTPDFCALCHEIKPAVIAWRSSTHVNNPQGFVADCMDCHLPAPHKTFDFFFAKTYHGAKDLVKHFFLKCHRNLLAMPDKRGAMLAHRSVIYARPGYEKKCVDCHYDLVHNESVSIMYKQYRRLPYQAKGLRKL